MSLLAWILALLLGGVVGLLSGLLGIGGGIVMVPFLYLLMAAPSWSGLVVAPEHQAALAHATSLFVIVPTALSGFMAYRRAGVMRWRVVIPIGIAAAVAAAFTARVAAGLPSPLLKALFGLFLVAISINLAMSGEGVGRSSEDGGSGSIARSAPQVRALRWGVALPGGALAGSLSALLGVGGGIVLVPVLIHGARLDLRRVAAASIGVVVFAASAGALGYVVAGAGTAGLPPGALGFVHLPAGLALLPGAVLAAPLGARLNQQIPVPALRRIFALLLFIVGLRLLWTHAGAFAGLG